MSLQSFKKVKSATEDLNAVQNSVQEFVKPLIANQMLDGIMLTNISLSTGSVQRIQHKLGRNLLGYVITRQRASAIIWDTQDAEADKTQFLALNCSANVTVDIWVF